MAAIFKPQYTKTDPVTGKKQKRRLKKWYIKYREGNGVVKRVAGYTDKEATRQLAAQLERQAAQEASGMVDRYAEHRKRRLAEHLEDYRKHLEGKGDSADHVQKTARRIEAILEGCRFRHLGDLSASHVSEWLTDRRGAGLGIQTSNYYLTAVKGFTRWLLRDRRAAQNPLAHLQALNAKTDRRRCRRTLSDAEFEALLSAARRGPTLRSLSGPDRAMLYLFAAYTGLRASELASLVPESFDFEADPAIVVVAAAYSKHRREDVLPLHPDVAAQVRQWLTDARQVPQTLQLASEVNSDGSAAKLRPGKWSHRCAEMLRFDLEPAGIPYRDESGRVFDFHSLRHQFISNLAKSGAHPKVAQQLARHSTITLTMDFYTHLQLADLTPALEALPAPPKQTDVTPQRERAKTGTEG